MGVSPTLILLLLLISSSSLLVLLTSLSLLHTVGGATSLLLTQPSYDSNKCACLWKVVTRTIVVFFINQGYNINIQLLQQHTAESARQMSH